MLSAVKAAGHMDAADLLVTDRNLFGGNGTDCLGFLAQLQ